MSDPRRALIVVDVQNEYFDGPLQIQYPPREQSLAAVVRALDTAARHDMPVVLVKHEAPAGVFVAGTPGWEIHEAVQARATDSWKRVTKNKGSVFAGTDLASWLTDQGIDTITLVGYMTNNCILASAAGAEELDLHAEVLSDATGAIHLANEAGQVSAEQLHETLMVLLHSNFAAVASTDDWTTAAQEHKPLPKNNLGTSATQGRAAISK
ncbi:MAG: isochorismatase family protein [Allobranchiibius sp.]|nr:isochorismatase family protein [Actinomycetota bacterium]